MIQNNAEILKRGTTEGADLKQQLESARETKSETLVEASKAEDDAQSLQLELLEIQAAVERKEEAERSGRETTEKIQELTG